MTSTDITNASKIMIGSTLASAMYIGSEKLWPAKQHEYVEIGGLRWATMNIGANNVTDYGLYFQWGDTQGYTAAQVGSTSGKKLFKWEDYKYGNGTSSPGTTGMTKYNATDGKTVLDLEDDAARVNRGGDWRMPTTEEFKALRDAVNTAWTASYQGSGVAGLVCTDKIDRSKVLFFPAAGYCYNGSVVNVGNNGYCWSSSLRSGFVQNAYYLYFRSNYTYWDNGYYRYCGFPVRAVMDIPHDYSLDYFTIESLEDNNDIYINRTSTSPGNKNMSYSLDGGVTWTNLTLTNNTSIATINTGDKILFKGINSRLSSGTTSYWKFVPSKNFDVCGNVMSLLFGDDFINKSNFASGSYQLTGLFYGTTTLINAKNLILPATTLANHCYDRMFMFCRSLITPPSLPATTLANYCYDHMFCNCTSLTVAPELPAISLASYCYGNMFSNCTSLNYIKAMFTTTPSNSYTNDWVSDVAASGTFVKNRAATWNVRGLNGIPSNWTVLTSSS